MIYKISSKFFITCCLVHVLIHLRNRSKMGRVWKRRLVVRVGRRAWVGLKHMYGVSCFYIQLMDPYLPSQAWSGAEEEHIQADRFSWIHTFHSQAWPWSWRRSEPPKTWQWKESAFDSFASYSDTDLIKGWFARAVAVEVSKVEVVVEARQNLPRFSSEE